MLFDKRKQEQERPRLQGEDFDIFPDLGEPKPKPRGEEPPPEPEDDTPPEPTAFQKRIAAIPDKQWRRLQIILGIVLGAGSAASIVLLGNAGENMSTISLLVAALLALVLPGVLEKQGARKTPVMRTTLIISLVAAMALFMFYGLVLNPSFFRTEAAASPSPAPTE